MDAGAYWAAGDSRSNDQIEDELKAMNLPAAFIDDIRPQEFYLWHDHAVAFDVFLMCQTQWNMVQGIGITGLNYVAVCSVMDAVGIKDRDKVLRDIRLIESGALKTIQQNKKQ